MKHFFSDLKKSYLRYSTELKRYRLLLLVPLALGLVLFLCVHLVTLRQIEKNGEYEVSRFSMEAHSMLNELSLVNDFVLGDENLQTLTQAKETPETSLEICRILHSHCSKSPYINDAYLICPERKQIYDERAYYSYDGLDAILFRVIGEDSAVFDSDEYLGWHVLNANYASPYYFSRFPDSDAVLLLSLNKTAFIRTLQNNSALVSCMFSEDFSISNLLINYPGTDWTNERQVSAIAGQRVKCFYCKQDGFTYMSALALNDYTAPLKVIVGVFCLYFLLVLVLGFLSLNRVSKRRYENAADLISGLPTSLGEDASYEDIVNELRRSMKEYREDYFNRQRFEKRNLLVQLIMGGRSGTDDELLKRLGLDRARCGYYLGLFYFSDSPGVAPDLPLGSNIDLTCTSLQAILAEVAGDYMDVSVVHTQRNYVAVISVRSDVVTDEDIRYILYETVGRTEAKFGSTITAFSSSRVNSVSQFPEAYQSVYALLSYTKSVSPDTSVLLQSDMESDATAFVKGDFIKQLQVLSSTLLLGKYDMIPALVKAALKDHVAKTGSGFYLAQSRLSAVANLLGEAVVSSSLPEEEKSDTVRALQNAESVDELIALTERLSPALSSGAAKDSGSDALSRACEFISANIGDANLSVPDVSEAAGVSVQHLARLFRSNLDTTVVERINSERISAAKKLILETNLSMNKIAEKVGYNNNVTFSRNFHRYVGMAPSEYRTLNSGAN